MDGCWYEIDPQTGQFTTFVGDGKTPLDPKRCYIDEMGTQVFAEVLGDLRRLLAPHARPTVEELSECINSCKASKSLCDLGIDASALDEVFEQIAEQWAYTDEAYQELLGRPPNQWERKWTIEEEVRRMAIGMAEFYRGKKVVREEWLYDEMDERWGRLRVFDDGSADAWDSTGLTGFDKAFDAEHYLGEAHYGKLELAKEPPAELPPKERANSERVFEYRGTW